MPPIWLQTQWEVALTFSTALYEATTSDSPELPPGPAGLLATAATQIGATRTVVDRSWPPIPTED